MSDRRRIQALLRSYRGVVPKVPESVFLADSVSVIGEVTLGERVNIWYGSVLRGDVGRIEIGEESNIQDLCCLHMTKHRSHTLIGTRVSIGHGAIIHGAQIEDEALIGMGVCLMDNVRVGAQSIVGAGTLVTGDTVIPPRSLVLGRPGKVIRRLAEEECQAGLKTSQRYLGLAEDHRLSEVIERES